ncbi:MBL fold metallo-hydrolase [Microbacterium sp. RD1]|uniref:MBL fold metallo-hydrolase n=1 Tax=Microbacterium sp. RD1 TaxID=3457313 RepID=UPI003FA55B1F
MVTANPLRNASPPRSLHIALWVLQSALGVALIAAGAWKLSLPFDQATAMFPWAADVPALYTVTSILDIAGGLGVILPSLTRVAPRTTVFAALGVVLLMLSAVVFYLLRGEPSETVPNLVLASAGGIVAWGRWRGAPIRAQLPVPTKWTSPLPDAAPPAEMRLYQLPTGTYRTRAALAVAGGAVTEQRAFAATAVLIQHPKGDVLIDAGFGAGAEAHIDALPSFRRAPHELADTASTQLSAAGYDRKRLLGVLLTHSHWDHVSGLDSLDVPIWMTAAERKYAAQSKSDPVFETVSRGHEIEEYPFDGPSYLGFPSSYDFYGDGSVVIVPAAGHTTGSVIIFVTVPSGQRYAFIGDLTWQLDGITDRLEKPLMMRMLADSDAKQVRQDMERVMALQDHLHVVPAHDMRGYQGIPLLKPSTVDAR